MREPYQMIVVIDNSLCHQLWYMHAPVVICIAAGGHHSSFIMVYSSCTMTSESPQLAVVGGGVKKELP